MIEILLSTYNGEMFIEEQVNSILNQSYKDWHLTIRDDGSTDSTLSVINRLASANNDKISIIDDNRNLGCKKSFETLLANADAEYYMFCDQDDVWLEDKIKHAIEILEEAVGKGSDIPCVVCSDLRLVDKDLTDLGLTFWQATKTNVQILDTPEKLSVNNYVAGCTMLFNIAAKKVSMPFGTHCIMHDAWIALKTLTSSGRIVISPYADILYRQHGGNTVGATKIEDRFYYLCRKAVSIKSVFKNNYSNYMQAKEILSISLPKFILKRVSYLIHR